MMRGEMISHSRKEMASRSTSQRGRKVIMPTLLVIGSPTFNLHVIVMQKKTRL
jgi:hypothetical protein